MILNLLRVEQLRVEEVMKRSFSEFHARKDSKSQEDRIKVLQEEIDQRYEVTELLNRTDYERYLDACHELAELRAHVQQETLRGNAAMRAMQPGRVVVLDMEQYKQHVAVTLKVGGSF